ncbi:MAG: ABC transporter substrate-binding protein [Gammaproteobacteria bacterium]|nr:ABC transporter substrate-binding protein [Gammaproteobacteria bacterium]
MSHIKLLSAVALSALLLLVGCGKKEGEAVGVVGDEILVGEFGSMTGNEATFGISTHQGIELAIEEINAAGGVKGKKIKLISLDDQGKPEEAVTAATKLITQDNVIALLGEVASSRSLAAAPIAQQYKIPMLSPSSTNQKVTEVGDYIFRVCFIDPFQGTVMAKFAHDHLNVKKVAVIYDVKSDYSVGLAKFFKETFTGLGGEIIAEQTYSGNDIDFKAQLTSIKTVKPEAIFIPGYYTEVGLLARQARGLGIEVPLLGGDGWDSSKLYEIGQEAIMGGYFSNHYTTDSDDPRVRQFMEAFKNKYTVFPDGLAAMGYDAAKVLADAIERSESLTPEGIRNALATTKGFAGVTGVITMDENRNPTKSAVVVQVAGTTNKYVTTIQPL